MFKNRRRTDVNTRNGRANETYEATILCQMKVTVKENGAPVGAPDFGLEIGFRCVFVTGKKKKRGGGGEGEEGEGEGERKMWMMFINN